MSENTHFSHFEMVSLDILVKRPVIYKINTLKKNTFKI